MALPILVAAALLFAPDPAEAADSGLRIEVQVTQKHLTPVCVNGSAVEAGKRRWELPPGSHSLAFTMRNAARPGVSGADVAPGIAVVQVVLEAGHKYEVEVRAPALTFSSRVWKHGEWKPVVRDRTEDRIVSSEPEWTASPCHP